MCTHACGGGVVWWSLCGGGGVVAWWCGGGVVVVWWYLHMPVEHYCCERTEDLLKGHSMFNESVH